MPDERPALGQIADEDDLLDGCDIDFAAEAVDELEVLQTILLGDTPPDTPEAEEKIAFYVAMALAEEEE